MHTRKSAVLAFHWIVGLLRKHKIPFQITGGMAAKIYGSPRVLHDIDLEIPDSRIKDLKRDVLPFIIEGPGHYRDVRWDLNLMTLDYHGQIIDISGAYNVRICDARTKKWKKCAADLSTAEIHRVLGKRVPVVKREFLAEYKKMLSGKHQKIDIRAVERSRS